MKDLTSRKAVEDAIQEFDLVGRQEFLRKYGFGPSNNYWLVIDGKRYDSKAIVGAAHGHQFPSRGPLKRNQFRGGQLTVERKLESLGFKVEKGKEETGPRYWAMCANPDKYRIDDAVKSLKTDYWFTGGSDLQMGDYVLIWRCTGQDGHRGVVAFGKVISETRDIPAADCPYWVNSEDGEQSKPRVQVEYLHASKLPLWADEHPSLKTLSVYRSRGGTTFHITESQWSSILKEAGADEELWAKASMGTHEGEDALALFKPKEGQPVLLKRVGISQHTDGVRIDEEFHAVFNPSASPDYTGRGQARPVQVLFNNQVFRATYRYEGQLDTSLHLESIRYGKDLQNEFRRVFPSAIGEFTISLGQDLNHFVFSYQADAASVSDEEEEVYAAVRRGQGFVADAALRKLIEKYAESKAKTHYERAGYAVDYVGNKKPYDFECRKDNNVLRVEVKGTTTDGRSVFLTANEVASARTHPTALFLVHSIQLVGSGKLRLPSAGQTKIYEPWEIDQNGTLRSMAYEYTLK